MLLALAGGAVPLAAAMAALWSVEMTGAMRGSLAVLLVLWWIGFGWAVRERVSRPLQTAANVLSALYEGDYSVRARRLRNGDALDELHREINTLSNVLQAQRAGALEASSLLRAVMAEIDTAIFAFDESGRLRLVNRGGERLVRLAPEKMMSRQAEELGLAEMLAEIGTRVEDHGFAGSEGRGRWRVTVREFRQDGRPHRLLVIQDLTRTLREEELLAWKRLVRVLGHEFNNSLAPIHSIAGSLRSMLTRGLEPGEDTADAVAGLEVIESRAAALTRFLEAYARLAKLPPPVLKRVNFGEVARRAAALERRVPVAVEGGELWVDADADQLEQMLINLVRNGAEAAAETDGEVRVQWAAEGGWAVARVEDDGPGVAAATGLFVPFFTTKPGGSGIGLVLARQIAEGHGGTLTLEGRAGSRGAVATVRLGLSRS